MMIPSSLSIRDDAIRQSNNLARRNFAKEPHHDATALCFKAIHPDTGAELGFIRLLKDKGVLELTNYNAWLPGKSLGIGGTSKTGNEQMAGSHGEGYKVAALTMKKHGFDVNTKASECDWEFLVPAQGEKHEGILCADIKKRRPARILTAKNAYARRQAKEGSITLRQNVWEDVTFTIGKEFKSFVTEGDFQQWINVALDLDPPTQVLETGFGNIILDDRFKNKVFLKGILLEDLSASSTLKFGYDIAQGEIDRERRRLASNQQAYQLAQIWGAAIRKELTMLMEYVTMLQSNIQPGDVKSAEIYMSRETTKLIWHHLVNEDVEHKKFYYDKENASEVSTVHQKCHKQRGG
jgi:hypothetical protein